MYIIFFKEYQNYINSLGRVIVKRIHSSNNIDKEDNYLKFISNDIVFYIEKSKINNHLLEDKKINILNEQLSNVQKDINVLKNKVNNKEFLSNAPEVVIKKFQNKLNDKILLKNKILNQIKLI